MNWNAFITCAITGAGDTVGRSPHVPVTPEQIATSAIEAAEAGAAVVHIHVRDPETGRGARDPQLYKQVVDQIRASGVDVVLNLTAGMGGDLVLGGDEAPLPVDAAATDLVGAAERLAHVELLRPEICTLDCGSMNFASGGDYIMVNNRACSGRWRRGSRSSGSAPSWRCSTPVTSCRSRSSSGRPARRSGDDPALHGHRLRRPRRPGHVHGPRQPAAAGPVFSAFSISRMQLPFVAMAVWPAATCASG